MCSMVGAGGSQPQQEPDLVIRLGEAIADLAAAADTKAGASADGAAHVAAEVAVTERLAKAWAMVVAADPDLATRTARYSG